MEENITGTIHEEKDTTPQGDFYRVKRYDEMPTYYNISMLGVANNFGYVQTHVIGLGESSTSIYTTLLHNDVMRLLAMQIDTPGGLTATQKMNKIIYAGKYIRPMWTNDELQDWDIADEVRNGACVYTNQRILIDKYATLKAKVPGQSYDALRKMGRLVCFKKSDWGKTYASHPWLIHHMTGVNSRNEHNENPHGQVFIPILDPVDFNVRPVNAGVIREYWIDLAYLV
jgi:hypothetical protein